MLVKLNSQCLLVLKAALLTANILPLSFQQGSVKLLTQKPGSLAFWSELQVAKGLKLKMETARRCSLWDSEKVAQGCLCIPCHACACAALTRLCPPDRPQRLQSIDPQLGPAIPRAM